MRPWSRDHNTGFNFSFRSVLFVFVYRIFTARCYAVQYCYGESSVRPWV